MTLQAVAPLTLIEVQTEFLAPLGTPLSAFLRGGAFVPDTALNAGVPTVLPIELLDLLGSSIDPGDVTEVFTMTAEVDGMGASSGYSDNNNLGVMTPDTTLEGWFWRNMIYDEKDVSMNLINIDPNGPVQDTITSLEIVGPNWNITYFTVDASFSVGGVNGGTWDWLDAGQVLFSDGQNYTITIVYPNPPPVAP